MTKLESTARSEYEWYSSGPPCSAAYLKAPILKTIAREGRKRVLDLGCGNGAMARCMAEAGFDVVGLDASVSGIEQAQAATPMVKFMVHEMGESLPQNLAGVFDAVISTEVIEHLLLPRQLMARATEALIPGGILIVSTPFHGYAKNLALAVAGRWDSHHHPLVDYGHVKFFSRHTLSALFAEFKFQHLEFQMAGRVPWLAKSMILCGRRCA